jgi:hypothetical protein
MQPYRDIDGDSGVAAYETGPDFIRVQFSTGAVYLYTHASAGVVAVAEMGRLAAAGDGLNSYINRHARRAYAARER